MKAYLFGLERNINIAFIPAGTLWAYS